MASDDSAERIRRRMAELRRELECDVREVGRSARVMTDWTFYVRKFPLAVAAVAAAAGFMLIPKKKSVIKPDPEMIAELVKQKKIRIEPVAKQSADKPGIMKSLLMMGITWGARAAMAHITQQMSAAAQKHSQDQAGASHASHGSHVPEHEPGPSPLQEPWNH
jgi:hypothetical protein